MAETAGTFVTGVRERTAGQTRGEPGWDHRWDDVNGLSVHAVEAGDPEDPLALLLHGFPKSWYSWREQLDALAEAGYHAVAPDLRGYNLTDKPNGVDAYRIERLVEDVAGFVDAYGDASATILGHDWGGIVGWEAAMTRPALVDAFVSIGITHPACFERETDRLGQLANSWHMYAFRVPRVPERMLAADDYGFFQRQVEDAVVAEDAFDERDFDHYRDAHARPGALTAMLNYYRANAGRSLLRKLVAPRLGGAARMTRCSTEPVSVSTLVLWGEHEFYGSEMVDGLDEWCADVQHERYPDASHWLHLERPERTNDVLRSWLAER